MGNTLSSSIASQRIQINLHEALVAEVHIVHAITVLVRADADRQSMLCRGRAQLVALKADEAIPAHRDEVSVLGYSICLSCSG